MILRALEVIFHLLRNSGQSEKANSQEGDMMRIAFFLLLLFSHVGYAQYFGESVLYRSFEHTDFFFTPSQVIPFGIGTFRTTMVGLMDDPLLNLAVNPAYTHRDSLRKHYLYLDFRTPADIRREDPFFYPILPYYQLRTTFSPEDVRMPYPIYFARGRKEIEPMVSVAYLTRPFSTDVPGLFLGATYQLLSQDEQYYPIPQDIYRPIIGYNYLGVRMAEATSIPIIDRFRGTDNIQHEGHFATFYAGYDLDERTTVGFKVGRVLFNRDGSFGSSNLWEDSPQTTYRSLWSSAEAREQRYRHWDLTAGVNYRLTDRAVGGLSFGYLKGNAPQVLTRNDSSFSGSGQINVGTTWNHYWNSGSTQQQWNNGGRVVYGGANLAVTLNEAQKLQFVYSIGREKTDIALSSSILDTSYSNYRWTSQDTNVYRGQYDFRLLDNRNGSGMRDGYSHRFIASLQWDVKPQVKMSIGLQLDVENRQTKTLESIAAIRRSYSSYSNTWSSGYTSYHRAVEEKSLQWNFETAMTRVQIPFILQWNVSDVTELLVGLNRRMSRLQIRETTLALFKYQEITQDSVTTIRTNFGERYVMPTERTSDVETAFLVGISVSPSEMLNIRFLVVPTVREVFYDSRLDWRWWIAVSLLP